MKFVFFLNTNNENGVTHADGSSLTLDFLSKASRQKDDPVPDAK